jgi:molybdate/tungstate transport system substrate-binding protein
VRSERRISRRAVLGGAASVAAGLAGCSTATTESDEPIELLVAGSLSNAVENGLREAVDASLRTEAHGSATVARLVDDGKRDPDIVSVADTALFDGPLSPPWYAEFVTNSLVVAYDADSEGGRAVEAAGVDGWYEPILDGAASLGRTDPDLDPLGYRTLFLFELASDHYGVADLRERIPDREQIYPETQLVSQFETGSIDAAVTYRSMAVDRGYDYVDLPPAIDLSDPAFADSYADASYELPGGKTVTGGVVSYASTVRDQREAVRTVFETHVEGSYLTEYGFAVPDDYPSYTGDVPDAIDA